MRFTGAIAMGRPQGIVELILDEKQVGQVVEDIQNGMPDKVKGALSVAPEKIFGEASIKSIYRLSAGNFCVSRIFRAGSESCQKDLFASASSV